MKTLPSQPLKDNYWTDVEAQLKTVFYDILFSPIIKVIQKVSPQAKDSIEMLNSGGNYFYIVTAIRSGRIQYTQGIFSGEFSINISKDLKAMGATFDSRSKVYRLDVGLVPDVIRAEATSYQSKAKYANDEIRRILDEVQKNLDRIVNEKNIDAAPTIRAIEKGWKNSAKILEVQPKLDEKAKVRLAQNYNNNLKLYIQKFSAESITSLRETVEANAMEGFRFDKLTEQIRHRYGVTANKARFLARQETSLFMSKYRQERFTQSGVKRYEWSTANDERVRDSHKRLNRRVFFYSDPPITDRSTGAKNNPGEDFNCRCVDKPILEIDPDFK